MTEAYYDSSPEEAGNLSFSYEEEGGGGRSFEFGEYDQEPEDMDDQDDQDDDDDVVTNDSNKKMEKVKPKRTNGRKGSGPGAADKRATHNAIERARRESLNGRFMILAEALPGMANVKRPSKNIIVTKALEYVAESQNTEIALRRENEALRQEVDELRSRLGLPSLPPQPLVVPQPKTRSKRVNQTPRFKIPTPPESANGGSTTAPPSETSASPAASSPALAHQSTPNTEGPFAGLAVPSHAPDLGTSTVFAPVPVFASPLPGPGEGIPPAATTSQQLSPSSPPVGGPTAQEILAAQQYHFQQQQQQQQHHYAALPYLMHPQALAAMQHHLAVSAAQQVAASSSSPGSSASPSTNIPSPLEVHAQQAHLVSPQPVHPQQPQQQQFWGITAAAYGYAAPAGYSVVPASSYHPHSVSHVPHHPHHQQGHGFALGSPYPPPPPSATTIEPFAISA